MAFLLRLLLLWPHQTRASGVQKLALASSISFNSFKPMSLLLSGWQSERDDDHRHHQGAEDGIVAIIIIIISCIGRRGYVSRCVSASVPTPFGFHLNSDPPLKSSPPLELMMLLLASRGLKLSRTLALSSNNRFSSRKHLQSSNCATASFLPFYYSNVFYLSLALSTLIL